MLKLECAYKRADCAQPDCEACDGFEGYNLVNLTPHAISIVLANGTVTIPPSGIVARCETRRETLYTVDVEGYSVPVNRATFGAITGLPDPAPHTLYIVSAIVAQAAKRDDVLIVDDAVRDEAGRIIGARALARV